MAKRIDTSFGIWDEVHHKRFINFIYELEPLYNRTRQFKNLKTISIFPVSKLKRKINKKKKKKLYR